MGDTPGGQRKTRKIRMSDQERDVLIRALEAQAAAADDDAERALLTGLIAQVRPKRRTTTKRYQPVFQVKWREGASARDCGHEHPAHLEAADGAQQLAARGIQGQVVPR